MSQKKIILLIILQTFLSNLTINIGFPPIGLPLAGIAGLSIFFYALNSQKTLFQRIITGFFFGAFFAVFSGKGILYSSIVHYGKTPLFAIFFFTSVVILPSAILSSIFGLFYHYTEKNGSYFKALTVPSLWTLFEYAREIIPASIPWANLGYTLTPGLLLAQVADVFGLYGLSFIAASLASLFSDSALRYLEQKKFIKTNILIAAAVLGFIVVYGIIRIKVGEDITDKKKDSIKAICIQGSHSPSDRWRGLDFFGRLSTYKSMTLEAADSTSHQKIIVWPESVLNMPASDLQMVLNDLRQFITDDSILVTGGIRHGEKGVYNSAFCLTSGDKALFYDKNILLPYAEKSIGNIKIGSFQEAPDEFLEGKKRPFFRAGDFNIGISICLEDLYPWFVRRSVNLGATILINMSADDWFGNTGTSEMHLEAARLRAIENRRYMIRCANSGISAIISPTGKIIEKTGLSERTSISSEIYFSDFKTIYSQFGDYFVLVSAILLLLSFAETILKKGGE